MATEKELHSDLAVPPGEYLEEIISELGMTKDEFARRMGLHATKLGAVFRGTTPLTSETATQLEEAVGVPANIWLGLESEYRLALGNEAGDSLK